MSDFARFCPKCYSFFRDPDLYAKHVEACGFAKDKTADSRRQTAAEKKTVDRKLPSAEKKIDKPQAKDGNKEDVESLLASVADCRLPSADCTEGASPPAASPKPPKFKT